MKLIEESGIEPIAWINQYGKRFRELTTKDPTLVENYEKGITGSIELMQERLESTLH